MKSDIGFGFSVWNFCGLKTVFHLWLLTGPGFIPETFGAAGNTFASLQERRAESYPARRLESKIATVRMQLLPGNPRAPFSSAGVGPADETAASSFAADLAASRILRKRFSYLISHSRPASKVIRSGDIESLTRLISARAGFYATNESAQMPGDCISATVTNARTI